MADKKTTTHSHNKKRNVGLIYEFLVRYMTRKIIENDASSADKALKILKSRYKKGTALYKEFRLFNSIIATTTSSEGIASRILREAKRAALRHDSVQLSREKSLLIREINYILNDTEFYKQKVPEYKLYATIQSLLNDWKAPTEDSVIRIAEYEDDVVRWLMKEKAVGDIDDSFKGVDHFVVKLMTEKLNKKYADNMNMQQHKIIQLYALYSNEATQEELIKELDSVRNYSKALLEDYHGSDKNNSYVVQKLNKIQSAVSGIELNEFTDHKISTFLMLAHLNEELAAIKSKTK